MAVCWSSHEQAAAAIEAIGCLRLWEAGGRQSYDFLVPCSASSCLIRRLHICCFDAACRCSQQLQPVTVGTPVAAVHCKFESACKHVCCIQANARPTRLILLGGMVSGGGPPRRLLML